MFSFSECTQDTPPSPSPTAYFSFQCELNELLFPALCLSFSICLSALFFPLCCLSSLFSPIGIRFFSPGLFVLLISVFFYECQCQCVCACERAFLCECVEIDVCPSVRPASPWSVINTGSCENQTVTRLHSHSHTEEYFKCPPFTKVTFSSCCVSAVLCARNELLLVRGEISNRRSVHYLARTPTPLVSVRPSLGVSASVFSLLIKYPRIFTSLLPSLARFFCFIIFPFVSPSLHVAPSPSGEASNLRQEQTRLLDIQFPACHALLLCMGFSFFSRTLFVPVE